MKIYEEKRTVKVEKKLTKIKCNFCKKEIKEGTENYYEITTGHHDWGNDSVDSIEEHEICESCVKQFVSDYLDEAEGTDYINIERTTY